eukprot:scaffold85966_cov35-Prasinocladus_malaysianus.AAC.1
MPRLYIQNAAISLKEKTLPIGARPPAVYVHVEKKAADPLRLLRLRILMSSHIVIYSLYYAVPHQCWEHINVYCTSQWLHVPSKRMAVPI